MHHLVEESNKIASSLSDFLSADMSSSLYSPSALVYSGTSIIQTPLATALMLVYRISEIVRLTEVLPALWRLVFKRYRYRIITINGIHTST